MQIVLRKCGNSTVAVLPPAVLRKLDIKAGQPMTLETTEDGKITIRHRHTLSELLAQCDRTAAPPADLALWNVAKRLGRESP